MLDGEAQMLRAKPRVVDGQRGLVRARGASAPAGINTQKHRIDKIASLGENFRHNTLLKPARKRTCMLRVFVH